MKAYLCVAEQHKEHIITAVSPGLLEILNGLDCYWIRHRIGQLTAESAPQLKLLSSLGLN